MASRTQCQRALDLYEDQLSKRQNVVGLGIVPAPHAKSGSKEMAAAVYVTKKVSLKSLKKKDVIPKILEIPSRNKKIKIPTCVIEQGKVVLEDIETSLL